MGRTLRMRLRRIAGDDRVEPAQVTSLREAVERDGGVNALDARRLVRMHKDGVGRGEAGAWAAFFVDAIADYYALREESPAAGLEAAPEYLRTVVLAARSVGPARPGKAIDGVAQDRRSGLSPADAGALVLAFRAEGGLVLDAVERQALYRLLGRLHAPPAEIVLFARDAIRATVSARGRVEAEDVALMRRVFRRDELAAPDATGRALIEQLFAILEASRDSENAAEWPVFFVDAVAAYLFRHADCGGALTEADAAWVRVKLGAAAALSPTRLALAAHIADRARSLDARLKAHLRHICV